MKNSKIKSGLAAAALLSVSAAMAQNFTDTTSIITKRDSTMNALDYVLQRPNPSPRFEHKRFGDHLFITAGGGADWTRTDDGVVNTRHDTGFRAGLAVGDWVSPVHGWRVSIEGGQHAGAYDSNPYFMSISADYLMNMTTLLRGDNPRRNFELIGLAGIEFQGLHRSQYKLRTAFGAHFGFQPRVYVSPNTFIYIEPRIGAYTDNIDFVKTSHKYDWNASVMLGVGYSLNRIKGVRNVDNSLFDNRSFRNYLFAGAAGGLNLSGSGTDNFAHRKGTNIGLFIGKWFSPASALRLSVSAGDLRRPEIYRRWAAIADLDYMWNINSTMNGYDPDRRVETNIIAGVSGMVTNGADRKINPALHLGAQGVLNINRNVGLFLEPSARLFSNSFKGMGSNTAKVMWGVNLGVVYRAGGAKDFQKSSSEFTESDFLNSRRYFIEAKGGIFMRERIWRQNFSAAVALGKWFSPGNAWRVTGEYDYIRQRTGYRSLTLAADYLGSLSTLAAGYDPDRAFDLSAVFGVSLGGAHYKGKYNKFVWGPHAGLRAAIRLSSTVDLLVEPTLGVMKIPHSIRSFSPEARVLAGISIKPKGQRKQRQRDDSEIMDLEPNRWFMSISGGPSLFSETLIARTLDKPDWTADISGGRWLSNVSGIQAGVSYDFIDRKGKNPDLYIGTVHVDYLLNASALVTGRPDTKFRLIGMVGGGIGWSNRNSGHASPELELGLQCNYSLTDNLSISFNPTMSFWRPALNQGRNNNHSFIGVGRMPVGITYSF